MNITKEFTGIKKISEYYKQLYEHKFNFEEMQDFLKTMNYLNLPQDEEESMESPISMKDI